MNKCYKNYTLKLDTNGAVKWVTVTLKRKRLVIYCYG